MLPDIKKTFLCDTLEKMKGKHRSHYNHVYQNIHPVPDIPRSGEVWVQQQQSAGDVH